MITFTVVTCTYNAESVVERTLQSVLKQSYPYVQHLILDGESSDSTVAIAKAYKQQSDEEETLHDVTVISEPDKGLYDAMNKSLRMATGTYVVFLNAGDTFPSTDTLENIADSVGDSETLPSVLYGETDVVDSQGRFVAHRHKRVPEYLSAKSFRKGMVVCHQSFYALCTIAKQVPYSLVYRYSADVDWCIRVMKEGERQGLKTKNVGFVLAHYLEGGMSVKNHRASLWERFRIMVKHYGLTVTLFEHAVFFFESLRNKLKH